MLQTVHPTPQGDSWHCSQDPSSGWLGSSGSFCCQALPSRSHLTFASSVSFAISQLASGRSSRQRATDLWPEQPGLRLAETATPMAGTARFRLGRNSHVVCRAGTAKETNLSAHGSTDEESK